MWNVVLKEKNFILGVLVSYVTERSNVMTLRATEQKRNVNLLKTYKLGVMMHRCLHSQAPRYLAVHLTPAFEATSRHRLRSANQNQLIVPRCRLSNYGRWAFSTASPLSGTRYQMNS